MSREDLQKTFDNEMTAIHFCDVQARVVRARQRYATTTHNDEQTHQFESRSVSGQLRAVDDPDSGLCRSTTRLTVVLPVAAQAVGGDLSTRLSRETASRHRLSRNMGGSPSGDAAASGGVGPNALNQPSPPNDKENVSPLSGPFSGGNRRGKRMSGAGLLEPCPGEVNFLATKGSGFDSRKVHSEDCGFPFLSHFEEGVAPVSLNKPTTQPPGHVWLHGNRPTTFWGVFRLSALSFRFNVPLLRL